MNCTIICHHSRRTIKPHFKTKYSIPLFFREFEFRSIDGLSTDRSSKVIIMFTFLIQLLSLYCATLSAQPQQLTVRGIYETLFEGRPLQVPCVTTLGEVSWWKNEIKIAEVNNGVITVNSAVQSMTFKRTKESFTMDFESLRVTDSGTYTCKASAESVTVEIVIYHNDQCIITAQGRLEYLVKTRRDTLVVACVYPIVENTSSVLLTSNWEKINILTSTVDQYINTVTGFYNFNQTKNGTTLNCFVNETGSPTSLFSCSVGPLYFYENPFVRINSSNDGIIGWKEQLTLCCRLVPLTADADFRWDVPSQVGMFEFVVSQGMSCLTMTNFEVADSELTDIVVTCSGNVSNTSYTDEYTFSVLQEASTEASDKGTDSSKADGGITTLVLVIIVLSIVVVILIVALLQLAIWCIIRKYGRKRNPTSETTSKQNQNVNDNAGFDDDSTYNEITREQPPTSPLERRVEINDEDFNSSDGSLESSEEPGNVNLRHQRPSTTSTVGSYSFVNRSPPIFQQTDSLYDSPPVDAPIYALPNKRKNRRRSSSHSSNEPTSGQGSPEQVGNNSMDDESGISISDTRNEDDYFELSNFAEFTSTQC